MPGDRVYYGGGHADGFVGNGRAGVKNHPLDVIAFTEDSSTKMFAWQGR